ncbi:MAG: SPFH domain-containing protein [Chlorobiaceae bacterium]|nr:SPFH domain-containing protein [Chlorobiaceae bacterium]
MGLWTSVTGQLRSVIEWKNPAPDMLFQRWTDNGDEIKNASKLLVGPGQGVIFVYEGKPQAVITEPGLTDLKTQNIPFWTTVTKFMQAFRSEHKAGIYFFRTAEVLNQGWGTPGPVKYIDPQYKFPVGMRGYGNFSFRISDASSFFVNVMGQRDQLLVDDLRSVIVARIVQPLTDFLAESGFGYNEIDSKRNEIAEGVRGKVFPIFQTLGFQLSDFRIENTDFDDDTRRRVGRIADMQAEAQAAQAVGMDFARVQQLAALRDAAQNQGGTAGLGVGLGAGMGLGQAMSGMMNPMGTQQPAADDPVARLAKLKQMLDSSLISQEEYDAKKQQILSQM